MKALKFPKADNQFGSFYLEICLEVVLMLFRFLKQDGTGHVGDPARFAAARLMRFAHLYLTVDLSVTQK